MEKKRKPIRHRCTCCNQFFPYTDEYFHPSKDGKYKLRNQCIWCRNALAKVWMRKKRRIEFLKRYKLIDDKGQPTDLTRLTRGDLIRALNTLIKLNIKTAKDSKFCLECERFHMREHKH